MNAQRERQAPEITFERLPTSTIGFGQDFSRTYNVFRGSKLKNEWLNKWTEATGGGVFEIPGLLSTSRDPGVGISFIGTVSEEDRKNGFEAFIWIITVANSEELFCLDSPEYSAYPHEREVLLMEGRGVYVLGKEKTFSSRFAQEFNIFYVFLW